MTTTNRSTQRRDGDGTRTRDRRDHKEASDSKHLPKLPSEQGNRAAAGSRVRVDLAADVRAKYVPVDMDALIERARQEFAKRRQPPPAATPDLLPAPLAKRCVGCDAELTGRQLRWCSTGCRNAHQRPPIRCRWTRDLVIERIQEWNRRFGRPPTVGEWSPSLARRKGYTDALAILAAEPQHWPSVFTVKQHVGGWPDAIRAAGLRPARPGRRSLTAPSRDPLREVAAA